MKHRKWMLALGAGLVAASAAGWIIWRIPPRTVAGAFGKLPKEEQARIRQAISRELWRQAFPSASWTTLTQAPQWLCRIATTRIQEGEPLFSDEVQVRVRSRVGEYYYLLRKSRGSSGRLDWRLLRHSQYPLVFSYRDYRGPSWFGAYSFSSMPRDEALSSADGPRRSGFSAEAQFAAALSNRAKMTLGH